MKRALGLILIITACVAGFLSIRGTMPFMPVFGTSMEPQLHPGNLILVEEVLPSEVKEGDNTGEDPFGVRPQDLRGTVSQQIPYLGFPLLFFQSNQGLIFIIIALSLFALYLYGSEISQGKKKVQRGIFAPVIKESRRTSRVMAQSMQATERRMESTEQIIGKFASAIEVYAQHLQSHTSSIQGLSEASQELKKGAAEQNKVLLRLMEFMEQPRPKVEEVKPKAEKVKFHRGASEAARSPLKKRRYLGQGKELPIKSNLTCRVFKRG